MANRDENFKTALSGKKIPILTLDNKWHKLFTQTEITPTIQKLENELTTLVKRQGKLNTESKDIRKIKKKLMDEIVHLADERVKDPDNKKLIHDMSEHKRLVKECSEKTDAYEEELVQLPRRIDKVNRELMLASMEVCYKKIQENTREIEALDTWIREMRRELKKKAVRKQEKEEMNNQLYTYMHDIFGADVIELFDMKYRPQDKSGKDKQAKKSRKNNNAPKS
ncbi:MAG: hypothetical protein NC314_03825 [Roseburia sp.]|nr:hypothetical protein [Roseburia sp.]MCM1241945.1 hypothetical protein [Roseburia sp.]